MNLPTDADTHLFKTITDAHIFKAEELEIQAKVLDDEAEQHEVRVEEIIQEEDDWRRQRIEKAKSYIESSKEKDDAGVELTADDWSVPYEEVREKDPSWRKAKRESEVSEMKRLTLELGTGLGNEESQKHEAQAARLRNQATRLRAQAEGHRRKAAEGN